jgi:hypothetical protein
MSSPRLGVVNAALVTSCVRVCEIDAPCSYRRGRKVAVAAIAIELITAAKIDCVVPAWTVVLTYGIHPVDDSGRVLVLTTSECGGVVNVSLNISCKGSAIVAKERNVPAIFRVNLCA